MLALTRRINEEVVIGDPDNPLGVIRVVSVHGDKVRLSFDFPRDVKINRRELADQKKNGGDTGDGGKPDGGPARGPAPSNPTSNPTGSGITGASKTNGNGQDPNEPKGDNGSNKSGHSAGHNRSITDNNQPDTKAK